MLSLKALGSIDPLLWRNEEDLLFRASLVAHR